MDRQTQFNLGYVVLAALALLWVHAAWVQWQTVESIPYSEFRRHLANGAVSEVRIGRDYIEGELDRPLHNGRKRFVTVPVDGSLAAELDRHGVRYSRVAENTLLRDVLSWVLPALVFFGIWWWLIRGLANRGGMGGGFLTLGKSGARVYVEQRTGVTFADVAGVDEAKEELVEIVQFLKAPAEYGRLGAHVPKGVLLVGPPGTGKTLLARAVAGEAGVPFFSISGSEFVEMFVGVGAARVRDLFEQARKQSPAIIFIDELDALGRARGAYPLGGHDEKEQTLNQLLVEMDGFDPSSGLVILAATNRPEILDPALLRAGRFDRQVLVDRPDRSGRLAILRVHVRALKLAPDVDLEKLAALTPGFSGAELANLANEAALLATRRRADAVTMEDFTRAIERIVAGLERKNRLLSERERRVIAHHEMGHAIVALSLPGCDPVHKISIIPRGVGALGYTLQRPTEERYLMTREELEHKMAVLLGGRAAEHIVFGHLSTGAQDDLAKATEIARAMVLRYGMAPEIGHVSLESERAAFLPGGASEPHTARRYSEATAREIDCAVREILDRAFESACAILHRRARVLGAWAGRLLAQETLSEAELEELRAELLDEARQQAA